MFAYPMRPHYRSGSETPWGGNALGTLFGKDIPDIRTGEALEASTLPGMESRAPDGRTLTEIAGGELPLLLKLLDAREALSVQVHPDDAYAGVHEGGKHGKEEAWLILHAEPGAKLVYGLHPGTDMHTLTPTAALEKCLRWVPVRAGDALLIPAGMVHAIGPGIVLYEIQQSSDVTYRFWDWDRRDRDGNPRALHFKKACDVAHPDLALLPTRGHTVSVPGGSVTEYIATQRFRLAALHAEGAMPLPRAAGFAFVTALCEGSLARNGETISFTRGQTLYVPRGMDGIVLHASGDVLISTENTAG